MFELVIPWITDWVQFGIHLFHGAAHVSLQDVHAAFAPAPPPSDPSIPNPGTGTPPPEISDRVVTFMAYIVWFSVGSGVLGVIVIGVRMTIKHQKGEAGNHASSLIIVSFGIILIVSAAGIVRIVIIGG